MTITKEIKLKDFKFWNGALDNVKVLTAEDFDTLEAYFEQCDLYDETEINDFFWFDIDFLACEVLGYDDFEQLKQERAKEDNEND